MGGKGKGKGNGGFVRRWKMEGWTYKEEAPAEGTPPPLLRAMREAGVGNMFVSGFCEGCTCFGGLGL